MSVTIQAERPGIPGADAGGISCPQCGTACAPTHHYCPGCGFPIGSANTSSEDRFVGRTLPGGYHILDLISVGGMGRVYRAEQSALGRTVAVKIIHPHLLADENSAVRFMTEARAASQLNHPNSVAVYDFGRTDDGQPYMVMEFLRGKDLARVAYEEGPISFRRIVDVLQQVLAALGEAHELGIVHRDLKPENVILEPLRKGGDFVKVVDFGLAKLRADATSPSVTSPGIVCGTPDYMAPEQGRGDPIDGRSDLYAVGVMLFQLLTGRLPFEAESPTQVVMMHLSIPVPDPRQVAPERDIPAALVDVTFRALEKEAERRYQDAAEFAAALQQALGGAEPVIDRVSQPPPARVVGSVTCPSCSSSVPVAKFCQECGGKLPLRSVPPPAAAPAPATFPLPLVGREDDLAWLEARRSEIRDRMIGARIVGEAGVGKTRLVRELARVAEADGDHVVRAGPDPYWAETPCYALREATRGLLGLGPGPLDPRTFDSAPPDARRGLHEIFEGGATRESWPAVPSTTSPAERRARRSAALRWALERSRELSSSGRVIVVIDELHRVDEASRAAFADLAGDPPPGCPGLIVAVHAPGFETGWGAQHAARVLAGLAPPAVARLLQGRSSDRLLAAGANSRGVLPLHVEHLVRFALEGNGDPPARLADLVAQRVDTLDPGARRVLQAVAVLGDLAEPKDIVALLPRPGKVNTELDLLAAAGMIERVGVLVSTAHPMLREVVLAGIPAAVRRDLHTKALRACEKRGAPLEACALHAYHSGDSFQALLLLEQVAGRAAARGDTQAEVLSLRRGLELARAEIARGELDDPLRAVLIFARKLGAALVRAGNLADAEGVLREALDLADPTAVDRARILATLAEVARGRGRDGDALQLVEDALRVARAASAAELIESLVTMRRQWVT
ncbi:MAG: protein kinase [Polyangiaceae bacterium]|nr:protein kinase [Polyangiaceae bacterium]